MSDKREQEDHGYHGDGGTFTDDDDQGRGRGSSVVNNGGTFRVSAGDQAGRERLKALAARDKDRHEAATKTDSRSMVRTQSHSLPPVQATPAAFRITSSSGRVLPAGEVGPKSIVHIGERTVDVGIAESVGLVARNDAGNLVLTQKGVTFGGLEGDDVPTAPAPKAGPTTPAEAAIAKLLKTPGTQDGDTTKDSATTDATTDKAGDEAIARANQIMQDVPSDVAARIMARTVEGSADIGEIAEQLGVTPEIAGERYNAVTRGYEQEASAHLRTQGVDDPAGFRAWAEGQHFAEFQGAVTAHLGGDLSGYDTLAAKFARVDAALSQKGALDGFEGTHEIGGETVTVYTVEGKTYFDSPKHGRMTLRQAILSGLVERDD